MDRDRAKVGRISACSWPHLLSVWVLLMIWSPAGLTQEPQGSRSEFLITSVPEVNPHNLLISFELVAKSYGSGVSLSRSDLTFEEEYDGEWFPLEIDELTPIEPDKDEELLVLFLLDVSGSMVRRLDFAKAAIRTALTPEVLEDLPPNTRFFISTFHDEISPNRELDVNDPDEILSTVTIGGDTDLYGAIIQKSGELLEEPGKKVLVVLSDGKQDVARNPRYADQRKPTIQDVYNQLAGQDSEFLIFPVALGDGLDENTLQFLATLPDSTVNELDSYKRVREEQALSDIFTSLVSGLSGNYEIRLSGGKTPFTGKTRKVRATWHSDTDEVDEIDFRAGSFSNPLVPRLKRNDWFLYAGMGVILLLFLFSLLTLVVPHLRRRTFMREYVHPHQPVKGRVVRDPISQEPILAGSLVVKKCHYEVPLEIWEDLGEKCPHFPDCVHSVRCSGAGAQAVNPSFFSQKGSLRKLNWLLFGGIGGFFSWFLYAAEKAFFPSNWLANLTAKFAEMIPIMTMEENQCVQCVKVSDDVFVGLCIGIGISLFLAIPDQLLRAQKLRVYPFLVKTIFGALAGALAFFCGSILQHEVDIVPLIAGLVSWLLFGILFACTLPLYSFISFPRAIVAGIVATIVSFIAYYLAFYFQWQQLELVRLVSLILLGGIIGFAVATVVSRLEDFEISFLAPDQVRGKEVPIGKWMNQGSDVLIGTSPKSHVFIKWFDSEVQDRHALISLNQNKVVLEALSEVLVDGRPFEPGRSTTLVDGSEIQLGRQSRTVLRFHAKKLHASAAVEMNQKKLAAKAKGKKS